MQRRFNEVSHSYALKSCIHGTYSTISHVLNLHLQTQHCKWWVFLHVHTNTTKSEIQISIEPPLISLTHSLTAAPFNFKTQSIVFPQPSARLRSGPPNPHRFRGSRTDTIASQSAAKSLDRSWISSPALRVPSSLTNPPFWWSRRQRLQRVENVGREVRHHAVRATRRIGFRFAVAIRQARVTIRLRVQHRQLLPLRIVGEEHRELGAQNLDVVHQRAVGLKKEFQVVVVVAALLRVDEREPKGVCRGRAVAIIVVAKVRVRRESVVSSSSSSVDRIEGRRLIERRQCCPCCIPSGAGPSLDTPARVWIHGHRKRLVHITRCFGFVKLFPHAQHEIVFSERYVTCYNHTWPLL